MKSFEDIIPQYTPMIYSIIKSLYIYKNNDEYFQAGIIGLWEAYKRFDEKKGSFTSFAYSSIRGKILTELTNNAKFENYHISPEDDFMEAMEAEWTTSPLEDEILLSYCTSAQLTEKQTKWVLYTFLKGLRITEIAEIEGVSPSAVKAWRAGAKTKLRMAATVEIE